MAAVDQSSRSISNVISRLLLLAVPLFLFPAAVLALCYNYAALILVSQNRLRRHVRRSTRFKPQNILISGVSTPAGLRTARALYQTGHVIVGTDLTGQRLWNHARWSKAIAKYRQLRTSGAEHEYIHDLLRIVVQDKIDLWIDCSDGTETQAIHARAKEVIERKSACACLVPNTQIAESFNTRIQFQDFLQGLGLPTLETHRVRSRAQIHSVLNGAQGKRYLLSTSNGSLTPSKRAVLPRRTTSQTYHDISQIKISQSSPWILEQYVEGLQRYSTLSIIVRGQVKAFAAYSDIAAGLQALPSASGLSGAMKTYVGDLAARADSQFSGHLSIDFCVDEKTTHSGVVQQVLPVEGRFTTNQALVLFAGRKGSIDLTKSYLAALAPSANGLASFTGLPYGQGEETICEPDVTEAGLFHLDQNVYSFLVVPCLQLVTLNTGSRDLARSLLKFLNQLYFWRDAVYEFWDPLPAFCYYLVYTPTNLRRWFNFKA